MLHRETIPTETPDITMPKMIDFFREHPVDALGIGCFGPLDLNEKSPTYGSITATPKLAWRDYPITQAFRDALDIPVAIDTDVNAAALAESQLGAGRGLSSCLYVTVGTGIGGGLIVILPVFISKGIGKAVGLWNLYGVTSYLSDILSLF